MNSNNTKKRKGQKQHAPDEPDRQAESATGPVKPEPNAPAAQEKKESLWRICVTLASLAGFAAGGLLGMRNNSPRRVLYMKGSEVEVIERVWGRFTGAHVEMFEISDEVLVGEGYEHSDEATPYLAFWVTGEKLERRRQ